MTREITHMKAFMAALESMDLDPLGIGELPPTLGIVDQFYNDSTGEGESGKDMRGPWNEDGFYYIEAPAQQIAAAIQAEVTREIQRASRRGNATLRDQPRLKRILRTK